MKHGKENSWKTLRKGRETENKENLFNILAIGRREGMVETKFEEVKAKNIPKLWKDIKPQIQE